MKNLAIGEAITALENGKKIAREGGVKATAQVQNASEPFIMLAHGVFLKVTPSALEGQPPMVQPFTFQPQDLLAKDWQVVE